MPLRDVTWFLGQSPPREAEVILYCMPNAGSGSAGYLRWQESLPPWLWVRPVQLPGRDNRLREQPPFEPAEIADALRADADRPYWIYGHSMGGVVALDVTHRLPDALPARLFVGASHPPHLECAWVTDWIGMSDDELLAAVIALGGVPAVVAEHARMRRRIVSVLRADLEWLSRQRRTHPVPVPITAIAGEDDPIAGPAIMANWNHFTPDFELRTVPGGHLFHSRGEYGTVPFDSADYRSGFHGVDVV